jgi:uncharacterized protein YhaN
MRLRAGAELAALERAAPQDTAEGMQARIDRYEKALSQRDATLRQLREEIVGLRARIAQEGGHGLDEQLAAAERGHAGLLQERDALARETDMLTLLLDTLAAAERETKERYLAPVVRRVTPYLRSLFPGADIACDDGFRITGLTRGAQRTEAFERLSDGTQEQIAVLARLAFAEMLVDQGKPAMVILDDALAYSDAERMERMFDILTQAARRMQVLILSCREDLFARIGGHRVSLARLDATATSGS